MKERRRIAFACLLSGGFLPLFGGTGRPSDGFLSFVLVMGFLLGMLGVLHLIDQLKRWIGGLLDGLY